MDGQSTSFGHWLRRRRKALDLTQGALALKVSCSPAAIKKIEAEERRPSIGLAQRLAEHLAVPATERPAFLAAARSQGAISHLPPDGLQLEAAPAIAKGVANARPTDQKSPFVGRNNEYGQFVGLLASLMAGRGQVVLIEGEAGIGKSRLLHEVADYALQRDLPILVTNCYEIERAIAYQPVIDLVTQACAAASEARLRKIAPILLAEIAALVPAMAVRIAGLPSLSADFPEARQARLFHALVQLFDALAQDRQLIVMLDDIQWADAASLRFVHVLARQIANRPLLLVCAYRDEELGNNEGFASLVENLHREPQTRHMALARLAPADTATLLERMNDPKLSAPNLATRLHNETDGNPFFLWSIMHSLGESNFDANEAGSLPLPGALRDSVRMRLARVPLEDRRLLEVAAVLGRRFDFETLLALTRAPEERFLQAIDLLVKRRLLREDEEGGYYDFNHDKVREVVYRDIGAARRVLLHRAVAERLELQTQSRVHERDARLAEHYERGNVWPKALLYLGLAGQHAQQLFAMREALQWFDRAVALLQAHPEAATREQQLGLYEQRGAARAQAGQTDGAVADFQRVIDAARALGQHEHARDVLIKLGMAYRRADAYKQALACLDEALTASRGMRDDRHAADTLYHLGTVAWSNGRNDLAITHHQQAVDICEELRLTELVAVQAFHGRGEAYFANAQPAAAIRSFSRSLELARGIADMSYESENLMMIGWACIGQMGLGDYARALSHFDAALDIARSADLQWHLGPTLIGRAHAQMALGRFGDAWAALNDALPRLETLLLTRYQMMAHDALGCLLLDLNLNQRASEHFERGLALAHDAGIMYWRRRLQANVLIAQLRIGGPVDPAALQAALRETQEHSEAWQTLRCLEALAESALAAGDAALCIGYADQLLSFAARGNLAEIVGRAHCLRGLAWLSADNAESARRDLLLAAASAERVGRVRLSWECHTALAQTAKALGDDIESDRRLACAGAIAAHVVQNLAGSGLTPCIGVN